MTSTALACTIKNYLRVVENLTEDLRFKWMEDNLLNNLSDGIIHVSACGCSADSFQTPFSDSAVANRRIGSVNSAVNDCRI